MRLLTLGRDLVGSRSAILELAANPRALWVGLLFVLSAGFAREYDGEDLLREPWYLLIPIAASLVASFLLFLIACGPVFLRKESRPPFWLAYRQFLTLFWLTAPLAWLYAIPYERFLAPGPATAANLWTLAFVAAWRVVLMMRVVAVVTGRRIWPAIFLVMAFADAVALTTVVVMPKPVVGLMGGVRLNESEAAVHAATFTVSCLGIMSAPVWMIGAVLAFVLGRPAWQVPTPAVPALVSRGVWILVSCSLLVWLPILPFTQSEQRLRTRVERDVRAGHIAEALDTISAHKRSDFPPNWEPPPRIGYPAEAQHILDVMDVLFVHPVAPWVRAEYVEKFRRYMWAINPWADWRLRGEQLTRAVRILRQLPEGPDIAGEHARNLKDWLGYASASVSAEERASMEAYIELAEKSTKPKR